MLEKPSAVPGHLFLWGFVKTADAVPELSHGSHGPHHHPSPRAGMQTVGTVESLISETSHQKDSLHTPDHNIVLRDIHVRYLLYMGD